MGFALGTVTTSMWSCREVPVTIAGRRSKRIANDPPHWTRISQGEVKDVETIAGVRADLVEDDVHPAELEGHLPVELHGAVRVEPLPSPPAPC